MHPFIQLKNTAALVIIASAITFSGGVLTAATPEAPDPGATGDNVLATPRAVVADFNSDGHPDYVLRNPSTSQTAIWYLNNNIFVSGAFGPTLPAGYSLLGP